jgi:hypothetical protein
MSSPSGWRGPTIQVHRTEFLAVVGTLLLLAVLVVRAAVPDRSRLRPLSVEGLDIPSEAIGQGQKVVREKTWTPPSAVYILGWNYRIGSEALGTDLILMVDDVRLFHMRKGDLAANPAFFQNSGAYYVRPPQTVKLMYVVTNTGPPGETRGAGALVYFVPADGN